MASFRPGTRESFTILGLLGAALLPAGAFGWTWDASYRHETENVGIGCKYGQGKEELQLDVSEKAGNGSLLLGLKGRVMDDSSAVNRVAAHVDYVWDVAANWHLSAGYQTMRYFRKPAGLNKQGNEIQGSVRWGNDLSVEGGVCYNFDEEDFGLYFSLAQSASLAAIGWDFLGVRSLLSVGYDHCARPGGVANFFQEIAPGERCGFFYYGWGGDLRFKLKSLPGDLFIGVRYAGNSAPKENWNNAVGHHRNMLWAAMGGTLRF
ncbi:MAG: hypothetical protein LBF24_02720 [Puniceicoccales bacterium]|jgi:hypothetical protein|nr:hypothetical protein [Puniceicoccales bacterium]